MTRYKKMLYIIFALITVALMLCTYYLWLRYYPQNFNCRVKLIQHHPGEKLNIWLNYVFDGQTGTLNMNGIVQSDENKTFNRKISFNVERNGNLYRLTSIGNYKFPDNNVNDEWMSKYLPQFFIYSNKSIYIRINKLNNGNYIFAVGTLPTYACINSKH